MEWAANVFSIVWTYKFSLLPVLVTYLLFDSVAIVRRLTGVAYVPIYFVFFPSGHSDQLYAQYFNEDYMYGDGAVMSDSQKQLLRNRIRATAIISMVFATIIAPWICGIVAALYLSQHQFFEFLVFFVVVKSIILVTVLGKSRNESQSIRNFFGLIAVMYGFYLLVVVRALTKSFEWSFLQLKTAGFGGMIWGILDYAYTDIFVNVIIVSAVTWGITTLYTSPANIPR